MKKVVLPGVTLNRVRRPIQRNLGAVANTKTEKTVETPVDEKVDEEPTTVITEDVKVDEDEKPKKTRKKKEEA